VIIIAYLFIPIRQKCNACVILENYSALDGKIKIMNSDCNLKIEIILQLNQTSVLPITR
jgi:hypothetical protein